ncbi:MAG: hypothetical protein AAFX55_14665 [Bacteroidota bacterium]
MKNALKLGKALSKVELKSINGGDSPVCGCCTSDYVQTGPSECQWTPSGGFGICAGVIVNGECCLSSL